MKQRVAMAVAGGVAVLAALAWPVPDSWFEEVAHAQVLDRNGRVLAEQTVPHRGRAAWVELDQVSKHVVDALIAAEDQRFYSHVGIDPLALLRAARADVRAGSAVQGGSTLTMQLSRLLAGRPTGLPGKAVEAWRAIRLDLHLDKDEILTWYLNRAYFGRGATGIEAAAQRTFDESASSVSLAEAALLVGLLPAPSRLHPSVSPDAARQARDRVLDRMLQHKLITEEEATRARSEAIELRANPAPAEAPHLTAHLLETRAESVVHSTVDRELQRQVEAIVADRLAALEGRQVDHAAVLVVELPAGDVRAWVGSGDFSAVDGENDGARTARSPGSALKPFLYALAFEEGHTPSEVIPDLPVQYATTHGTWAPRNYSESFTGPVSLRTALATSGNVPAVRLLDDIGVPALQERLVTMGLPLDARASTYGLGLTLGGGEVTLEQLVAAYTTLARDGLYAPLRVVATDEVPETVRVFSPMAAWQVSDVLADPIARAPAFGRDGILTRPYPASAKTGTSTGFRDNWTVGYTDRYVVGVWVGNFDGRPMGDVSGVTGAGPIWAAVLDEVTGLDAEAPAPPGPTVMQTTCALSGLAAGPHCTHSRDDRVPEGTPSPETCTWHDACGVRWPAEYLGWAGEQGRLGACQGGLAGGIRYPVNGTVLYVDPRLPASAQRVPLRASASAGSTARWEVDGVEVHTGPADQVALWTPTVPGEHGIELFLDGAPVGQVRVHVGGVD
ncbi:MAG: penicillin-binding protein 1C [Proteobacteria bacterium]|nr:penicillin-binding protein 1C [Pseudomonadota bacterium]